MCSDLLSQETHSVVPSLVVFPSKQYFILCSFLKSSIQLHVLSEVYFFLFGGWERGMEWMEAVNKFLKAQNFISE